MNKSKSQFEGSNIGQSTHLSHYLHSQLQSFETGGKTQPTKRQRNPQTQHFKGKRMPEVELGTQLAESPKRIQLNSECFKIDRVSWMLHNDEYNYSSQG